MKKLAIILSLIIALSLIFTACDEGKDRRPGTFYTAAEVYSDGKLTKNELLSLAYYVNFDSIIDENKEQYPQDFVPLPKEPKELDEAIVEDIKSLGYNIDRYCGKYGDYYAVVVTPVDVELVIQIITWDGAGGLKFMLSTPAHKLFLYKVGGASGNKTYSNLTVSKPTDSMLFDLIEYNYGAEYQAYRGGYSGELPDSFEEMYDYMHIDLSETLAEWQNSEFNPDNMAHRPSEEAVDFSNYNEVFFENKALLNFYYIYPSSGNYVKDVCAFSNGNDLLVFIDDYQSGHGWQMIMSQSLCVEIDKKYLENAEKIKIIFRNGAPLTMGDDVLGFIAGIDDSVYSPYYKE